MRYVSTREAATMLGLKPQTLRRWRSGGRGPLGWIHLSETRAIIPADAVEEYISKMASEPRVFGIARRRVPE